MDKAIEKEGYDACLKGRSVSACPYAVATCEWYDWSAGWLAAYDEVRP